MTLVEGEELQRLWTLVSELSSQLSANQQLCQSLQQQADELKGHALHSGTGYTLRRFNTDISREKFESELEKVNAQLVLENQALAHDNKQTNLLLREYESTIEQIMAKFRSFSHATQQHTLALTSHYETLLANNAYDLESAELHASTAFSERLTKLGSLVRLAFRDEEGESQEVDQQDGREPRWFGTGGYTGSQGDPEAEVAHRALQGKIEEEKLRKENESLRDLLRISADLTPETAERMGVPMPIPMNAAAGWGAGLGGGGSGGGAAGASAPRLSLGKPRGSRKSLGESSTDAVGGAVSAEKVEQEDEEEGEDEGEGEGEGEGEEEGQEEGDFKPIVPSLPHVGPASAVTASDDEDDSGGVIVTSDIADEIEVDKDDLLTQREQARTELLDETEEKLKQV